MTGHYAHTLGEYNLAISLFGTVINSPTRHLHKLASLSAALSELQRSTTIDDSEAFSAAKAWLDAQNLSPTTLQNVATHEKATAQLINGIILLRKNDATGARLLLTKALKQAHGLIGSTQLVGQVLNVLAPVQKEREDLAGAKQMFDSSITLLKALGDLPSLVTALHGLHAVHEKEENEALATKSQQYLARKAADLDSRMTEVKSSAEHAQVVEMSQWLIGAAQSL